MQNGKGSLRAPRGTFLSLREIAEAQGRHYYDTGKPCKYGHISPRYTSNGNCCTCKAIENDKRRKDPEPVRYG